MVPMRVCVLNVGSATAKAAQVEVDGHAATVVGRALQPIGLESERRRVLDQVLRQAVAIPDQVEAVGHRIVHGGTEFIAPVVLDHRVERRLAELSSLAPLHNPPALDGIQVARDLFPGLPMVAVFDTAFHASRPLASRWYGLPWELAESLGLYRYGFHGIAHASLVAALAEAEDHPQGEVTAVTLQLGAGCSACAVQGGRSVETSMGFSPLEGLMMPSRTGSIDAAVVLHLIRRGASVEEVETTLTRRSGMLGLAGSADVRELLAAEAAGDARAALALSIFVHRIVATVGAYWTLLAGRGPLVFGGGIGSHSPEIRLRIAAGLAAWGVALDTQRNAEVGPGRISMPGTRPTYVFETNEEQVIARETARCLLGADP